MSFSVTQKAVNLFVSKANQAVFVIYINVDTEFKRNIDDCREPMVARRRLERHFHPDTRFHHMALFTELMEI